MTSAGRTLGRTLSQPRASPTVGERPPASSVCVFPTEDQLAELVDYVRRRSHAVVSVGCGEGFLEGQLGMRPWLTYNVM